MTHPGRWLAGPVRVGLLVGGVTALLVAAVDSPGVAGGLSYLLLGCLAGAAGGWLWLSVVGPHAERSLFAALVVALALRLGIALALRMLLPSYGNDVAHHAQGFFFPDAFVRDQSAWALGRSQDSLWLAFASAKGDQYGTLLFLSAGLYRVLGGLVEQAFIPSALAAAFGALAVLMTWGFAESSFGRAPALVAAWIVALYPDAVLLGAQNMREPYVMAGMAAALYGYACLRRQRVRTGVIWIAAGSLVSLAVSPPLGFLTVLFVGLATLWEGRAAGKAVRWAAPLVLGTLVVTTLLTVRAWSQIEMLPSNPIGILTEWWTQGIAFELGILLRSSPWIEPIFQVIPAWSRLPFVTVYGLLQPFLPAALMDNSGVPLMSAVMIWRALGWFALLPFLLYAPLASVRAEGWRSLSTFLAVVFLLAALLISLRFAGDQWDNPRYRMALLPTAAALIGWAWAHARASRDPWLLRCAALVAVEVVIISWWYAGRYYHVPRISFYRTTGLAAVIGVLILGAGVLTDWRRRRRA